MRFQNKTAVVTGAASGIGEAVVGLLREEGASVIGFDKAFSTDVTVEEDWVRVLSGVNHLDVLVSSAGISQASPLIDTSLEEWRSLMAVNVDGAFLALKHCLPLMTTGGSCVLVGSASGTKAAPGASAYSVSKAALKMLARAAALEMKPRGIRVNSIAPAGVVTPLWTTMPFWKELVDTHGGVDGAWKSLGGADPATVSIQRMAFPEEIARAILFLCCDDAAHISGTELAIDGGYTA